MRKTQIININRSSSCINEKTPFVIRINRSIAAFVGKKTSHPVSGNRNIGITGRVKIIDPRKTLAKNWLNDSAPAANPIPNIVKTTEDNTTPAIRSA